MCKYARFSQAQQPQSHTSMFVLHCSIGFYACLKTLSASICVISLSRTIHKQCKVRTENSLHYDFHIQLAVFSHLIAFHNPEQFNHLDDTGFHPEVLVATYLSLNTQIMYSQRFFRSPIFNLSRSLLNYLDSSSKVKIVYTQFAITILQPHSLPYS